jgi:hypothetical protein
MVGIIWKSLKGMTQMAFKSSVGKMPKNKSLKEKRMIDLLRARQFSLED